MDSTERLVNLALYLAGSTGTITAEDIRANVAGYPPDQDEPTFKRMLERDKDLLRSSGLVIDSDAEGNYHFDARASFAAPLDISIAEAAALRAAGAALVEDASFPFRDDLRLALAKISADIGGGRVAASASLADEHPQEQGAAVSQLAAAAHSRKRVRFDYINSSGDHASRTVEPYGLFLHDGRWYLVGRDLDRDEVRTYAVARAGHVDVEARAPKTPDFERPSDFDIASYARLPFQYGLAKAAFEAVLVFEGAAAQRAHAIAGKQGLLREVDGHAQWTVEARSAERLARFVVENGPGISIASPPHAVALLPELIGQAVRAHG